MNVQYVFQAWPLTVFSPISLGYGFHEDGLKVELSFNLYRSLVHMFTLFPDMHQVSRKPYFFSIYHNQVKLAGSSGCSPWNDWKALLHSRESEAHGTFSSGDRGSPFCY